MIAYVEGKLTYKDPTFVIIESHGIGYQIKISLNTYGLIKEIEKCRLHTYLHIKEDAHTLFGFYEISEKKIFTELISISGVGPSTALMVLSSLSSAEVQQAIVSEDVKTIQSVKGIGTKTAQRLILELKDKFRKENYLEEPRVLNLPLYNTIRNEALSALVTLGISKAQAERNVDMVIKKEGKDITLEHLIRLSLKTP